MGNLFDTINRRLTAVGYALAVLAKGRVPPPPVIMPQYIFGATFPF